MRLAVLASGNGSNFEAIVQAVEQGLVSAELAFVFSDKKDAYVLERAAKHGIKTIQFSVKDFSSKALYEAELRDVLIEHRIDLVVLAGYMRIIGPALLDAFTNRIINLHPSLLPSFPGLHGIKDAFDYGVKVTGITIHYVDAGVDTGPIIEQVATEITTEDTLATLEEKIHRLEHETYPRVLAKLVKEGVNEQ